ncbi:MAG: adenylate/guanylate cyclase domain-containing protein [Rhodoferax sp.]|nr:adenylate/guanylate cyclase domain-containing protein [Rhodoferax sp.]
MRLFSRHWPRMAVTLVPLVLALLQAVGVLRIDVLQRLDDIIYDARLRATMPGTLDPRIVIVDFDENSLAQYGWPWSRNKLAALVNELTDRQKAALIGFDMVFAEADQSSGLAQLRQLAQGPLREQPGFAASLARLQGTLDYDAVFAQALAHRPVVLGYYFTSDRNGHTTGQLPQPVMDASALQGRPIAFTRWDGYGANLAQIAAAAPVAGFFNSITEDDGVVRSIPLLAEYGGRYYESLSLALFRRLIGEPQVAPGFPRERYLARNYQGLESILLGQQGKTLAIPVDDRVAALVPFRGRGGPAGGSFQYIPAADVLAGRLPAASLQGKIVLIGTTAPGLLDLRATPVGTTYPGVETHANLLSSLLDGKTLVRPDYAAGFEVVLLLLTGLLLAFALPLLSAPRAVLLSVAVLAALVGLNLWLYLGPGLVLPLASVLLTALAASALNMSYGFFVESRSKRELAHLFGTYVPPELVHEMLKDPDRYSMQASARELTVMFCDMRGFTQMSESMEPVALQALLNSVFSRLTALIRHNRGTVDKYMGDCVMAFWGAPVDTPRHAHLAVQTALEMTQAVQQMNLEHRTQGLPEIGIGIGLNTGIMCVGDMGSDIRRSYTVIGDAVNLGSRLEGLCKVYGVDIVVSESTRRQASDFAWQELDRVRVKGKQQAVAIFRPVAPLAALNPDEARELELWAAALQAYRSGIWGQCELQLLNLKRINANKYLYQLYSERVALNILQPFDPAWDGATSFETK